MALIMWGISYRTASIAERQVLAWNETQQKESLLHLKAQPDIQEIIVLSTCNRTEFYLVGECVDKIKTTLNTWLKKNFACSNPLDTALFYHYQELEVAQHLFQVSCGMDSLLRGENHILHQVKNAFQMALNLHSGGKILNHLFRQGIQLAKAVQSLWQSHQLMPRLEKQVQKIIQKHVCSDQKINILFIGAGKINTRIATALSTNPLYRLTFINRTFQRAQDLAEKFTQNAVPWESLDTALAEADVVIACTHAGVQLVSLHNWPTQAVTKPRVFMDLSVPQNLDPRLAELPQSLYFDIDAVNTFATQDDIHHLLLMQSEQRLQAALDAFEVWYQQLDYHRVLSAFSQSLHSLHQEILALYVDNPTLEALTHQLQKRTLGLMAHHLKSYDNLRHNERNIIA